MIGSEDVTKKDVMKRGGVTKKKRSRETKKTQKRKGTMAVRASAFSSESPSPFFKKPKQRKCIL